METKVTIENLKEKALEETNSIYEAQTKYEQLLQNLTAGEIPSTTKDNVNHPSHYTFGKYECVDIMEDVFGRDNLIKYCTINAFKYLWRTEHKNGIEDIKKAKWYLNKAVELIEKEETK